VISSLVGELLNANSAHVTKINDGKQLESSKDNREVICVWRRIACNGSQYLNRLKEDMLPKSQFCKLQKNRGAKTNSVEATEL
jgi:hypothetical protein